MMQIRKAVKGRQKLRLGLIAPTGAGKTLTGLEYCMALVQGTDLRVGVIDSERESSELYADRYEFDVIQLTDSHSPESYMEALKTFADAGNYGAVLVDSLSHAWMGKDGTLESVDKAAKRGGEAGKFGAWRDATPLHNRLVDALLATPFHLVVTLRSKMEYVMEQANGKTSVKKIGLQPVQRDGLEYEFTVVADIDIDHTVYVGKTRCSLVDGKHYPPAARGSSPDATLAKVLRQWIESGADKPEGKAPSGASANTESVNSARSDETDTTRTETPEFDRCSGAQAQLIEKMIRSHVITEDERKPVLTRVANGTLSKDKAKDAIDWLTRVIKERKAAEKAAAEEPETAGASA